MKVYKGEKIQIAGGFLPNGESYCGFEAEVEFQSNLVNGSWEVCFYKTVLSLFKSGSAIFDESLNMWDVDFDNSKL